MIKSRAGTTKKLPVFNRKSILHFDGSRKGSVNGKHTQNSVPQRNTVLQNDGTSFAMIEERTSLSGSLSSRSKGSDTDLNNRLNKSVDVINNSKEDKQDSEDEKHNIGKKKEELKFK